MNLLWVYNKRFVVLLLWILFCWTLFHYKLLYLFGLSLKLLCVYMSFGGMKKFWLFIMEVTDSKSMEIRSFAGKQYSLIHSIIAVAIWLGAFHFIALLLVSSFLLLSLPKALASVSFSLLFILIQGFRLIHH